MRVWVTRAQPGAEATAGRLRALGFDPLVAPVLEARPLVDAALDLDGVAALTFTSRHGVEAFASREASRRWPVFAVGDATAAAACAAGFTEVASASRDVEALARLITSRRPDGLVLHAGAAEPAGDLAGALRPTGIRVRTAALYETCALPITDAGRRAWTSLHAVLIHSPKAARVLAEARLGTGPARLLCISEAAAEPLGGPSPQVSVAASPDETALLTLLAPSAPLGAATSSR